MRHWTGIPHLYPVQAHQCGDAIAGLSRDNLFAIYFKVTIEWQYKQCQSDLYVDRRHYWQTSHSLGKHLIAVWNQVWVKSQSTKVKYG